MFFVVVSVVVPVVVYFAVPAILKKLTGREPGKKDLLVLACVVYFISWYLPSPDIEGRYTAFTTHFVGGGIFSAVLWLYIRKNLRVNFNWFLDLAALYALVSSLGVANELFELAVTQARVIHLNPSDTWWDLLANTSGALCGWGVYIANSKFR